jgi:hypothetical protein
MEYIVIAFLIIVCLMLLANNTALKHRYVKRISDAKDAASDAIERKEIAELNASLAIKNLAAYKKDYEKKVKDMDAIMSGKKDELMKDKLFHQLQADYKELEDKILQLSTPTKLTKAAARRSLLS